MRFVADSRREGAKRPVREADAASVRSKAKITVATATPGAKAKVEEAGGAIAEPTA